MTGMIVNWESNPRYQRLIQRIGTMRPEQRAILDSAAADTAFGDEAMRKYLSSLSMAADEKYRNRALGIEESKLNVARNLAEQEADIAKKQTRIGTAIAAANIPISGYFGMKQMDRDKEEAAAEAAWRKSLLSRIGGVSNG
jgi:hypothetical protein